MTLASDIAADMAGFDGVETVSLYDVSATTTDASVSALRRAVNQTPEQGGALGVQPNRTVWHIQASTTAIVPDVGDTITDSSSVVWTIDSVSKVTSRDSLAMWLYSAGVLMPDPLTLKQFNERLDRIEREFPGDMQEALTLCIPEIWKGIGSNFDRQQTASGASWPPRKDQDPELTHSLLHLTGALEEAATGVNPNLKPEVKNDELTMGVAVGQSGTSLGGARVHQEGYPERNIAQREYMGFTPEAVDECVEIVADAAVENIMEVLR